MMDQFLTDLCKRHGLTAISVSYATDHGRFGVFLHWKNGGIAHAYGKTTDDAVARALAAMSRIRADASRHSGEAA